MILIPSPLRRSWETGQVPPPSWASVSSFVLCVHVYED